MHRREAMSDEAREIHRIAAIHVPEIAEFEPIWLCPGGKNPDGVGILTASQQFRSDFLFEKPIQMRFPIPAETLFVGILARRIEAPSNETFNPIRLAQLYWFLANQPMGEEGPLIRTGWWNGARIRERPNSAVTLRFKPAEPKKGLFSQDETPPGIGWVVDEMPANNPKLLQAGRLLIWSRQS
jgi:hypothetical protein